MQNGPNKNTATGDETTQFLVHCKNPSTKNLPTSNEYSPDFFKDTIRGPGGRTQAQAGVPKKRLSFSELLRTSHFLKIPSKHMRHTKDRCFKCINSAVFLYVAHPNKSQYSGHSCPIIKLALSALSWKIRRKDNQMALCSLYLPRHLSNPD